MGENQRIVVGLSNLSKNDKMSIVGQKNGIFEKGENKMKTKTIKIRKVTFLNHTFVFKKTIKIELSIPEVDDIKTIYFFGYEDFDIDGKFICKENDDSKVTRLAKNNFAKEIYFKWRFYISEHESIQKEKIIYRANFFKNVKQIRISYD